MFVEYPHIENTYQAQAIEHFLAAHPDAAHDYWVVEEKINGTNMQINIDPQGNVELCSRGRVLPENEDHYGFKEFIKTKFADQMMILKEYAITHCMHVRLYGEFFGPKICKGVDYGKEKRLIFFGMMINEKYQSQREFYDELVLMGLTDYLIRNLGVQPCLTDALNYDTERSSWYSPTMDMCEGVVIKPFANVYLDDHGKAIYFKKKNEQFWEKQHVPKEPKPQGVPAEGILLPYLNANRIQSCYSKLGPIKDKAQIGDYMKAIRDDIVADWQSEHPNDVIASKETGILNPAIAKLLLHDL